MGDTADLQPSTGTTAPAGVSIELTAIPVLSSALAHSAVPVVSRLALTSDADVRGAVVRLTVTDAQGPIGEPVEVLIDLTAGRTTVRGDVGLTLDPAAMRAVPERRPGWVRVEVTADGRLLGRRRVPVHVLAAGQWLATPAPLALEMLAAHVQPAHPAVRVLLDDAAGLLEERTGNASTEGSAAGPARVDQIVAALAEALRRRAVRHSAAPASWADIGQLVRTPGEVLDGRVGTCLDTVVTLASACERAGIRTLLWLVESSGTGRDGESAAFLGYWREERNADCAATTTTTDVAALVNSVDLGRIRLVETTLLTDRGCPGVDLHRPPYAAWLTGDLGRVLGVTDVHRARTQGIRPLPTPDADGSPDIVEQRTARLPAWQDVLLDLSPRNRLIDFPERAGLALTVPPDALAVLGRLLHTGAPVTLLPGDRMCVPARERGVRSARDLPAEQLTELLATRRTVHSDVPDAGHLPRLRGLAHQARTGAEETGANDLFLALGSLAWALDGRPVRSPLVLVPVVLTPTSRNGGYRLGLDESGTSTPNGCLLELLRRRHGLTVPGMATPGEDGVGIDLDAALAALRTALAEHGLPFRVEPTAELAVLPFAAYRRWRDLDEHGTELAAGPLVAALAHAPDQPFTDPAAGTADPTELDELAARCPLPADAAQLRALAEAGAGRTFVLEGAPGTGKSHTITNLLARAVADGKRVLFVAGKRTALDVVARRLDAVGMGPFALDLHGEGSRPAAVRAQVRAALEHAVEADAAGLAADTESLRTARRELARYADQLHAANGAGLSYYSARTGALAAGTDVPALPMPAAFVADATPETMTAVRRALALLPDIADLARPSTGHAWAFIDTMHVDITAVQQAAVSVDRAVRELPGEGALAAVVRAARTPEHLEALVHLLTGPKVTLEVLDEVRTERWSAAAATVTAEVAALVGATHPGFDVATPAALGLPLGQLFVDAQAAAAAGWLRRRARLAPVRTALGPTLRPGAKVRRADVPALTAALRRVQVAVRTAAQRATAVPGLRVPATWNPFFDNGRFLLEAEVSWLRRAAAAVDGDTGFAGALRRFLSSGPVADGAAADLVGRLRNALSALMTACSTSSAQWAAWSGDGFVLRWTMTRPERGVEYTHPVSLRRWVSLLDTLEPLRDAGLVEARRALLSGVIQAEDAVRAFDRGLADVSGTERRDATGLSAFDGRRHQAAVARFTAASRAVRRHLVAALPAGVLADRPVAGQQVAALQRELDRGGLGVRGLLAAHGELITAVTPCVLAGPDDVARFLPAVRGLFDLVVIDEASQLRVADAVGALGRASAAVVVGDSRQLPPTCSPAPAVAGEPADDAGAVGDEESVLAACLRAGVPRRELTWHYRSQDESLIAFSNARYYRSRLSSFPAPAADGPSARPDGHGVSLVQVGGTFHRTGMARLLRTNPVEASAVVSEVLRRFDACAVGLPSIGVVAFSTAQRAHIEDLLRDCGDDRVLEALARTDGEGLFVKDLESVQGDEREVVLLSTAFSPDARGRLPLDFGPLNRAGGERLLNVAVTRARRQVIVFSSFAPEQLRAEDTASTGIAHLRAYLDLAGRGVDALPRAVRPAGAADRHREEVAAALRSRGLVVCTDVGLSEFRVDLTVARAAAPDAPVLAVLLDGPAWAARRTVGDRDGLPVDVLSGLLGWPAVERVWLPSWLTGRNAVLDRLVAAVEATPPPPPGPGLRRPVRRPAAATAPRSAPAPRPASEPAFVAAQPSSGPIPVQGRPLQPARSVLAFSGAPATTVAVPALSLVPALAAPVLASVPVPAAVEPTPATVPEPVEAPAARVARVRKPAPVAAPLDDELPFVVWTPKPAGDRKVLDSLADAKAARAVRRVLTAGVKAEGPVHVDRLVKATAAAFGLTRVTAARRTALLALLPEGVVTDDVAWPADLDPSSWRFFRRQAASGDRSLDQVAPEEIGNAMAGLCRARGGLAADELFLRTVEVFGHRRRTPALLPVLDAALVAAVTSGRLTEAAGGRFTT
ncbi:Part of AAA domain-containing protein [Modestobacter sp. DSM 44400]|uniref:DUF4011 domain-containing protein n=1 Tax=Modestobacter sp. DSM 44400 TaxID=1550230 RepID=UPI00089BEEA8|nr:DUF4011 domain-containing protein [Modestobacter sp. DSM 44400]SDY30470.1 Part of AAA domain-containing protein [Modestobacter sp. DSM 44400]